MEHVLLFLNDMREKARRKGGNLYDMFEEYDPKQTGLISFTNFRKLLANINLFVDDEKFEFITTPYSEGTNFYYAVFLHDMEDAKVDKTNKTISIEELRQFGSTFRDQGTDVAGCLKLYDRHHTGRVDPQVFFRYVSNTPLAQKIAAEYMNSATREIEYMRLNQDIQNALAQKPPSTPRIDSSQLPAFFPDLAKWMKSQAIDPVQLLMRYDRYKRRQIPTAQFLSEVANWGVPLKPLQLNELAAAFDYQGQFDYMAFADEIQKIQTTLTKPTSARKPVIDLNEILNRLTEFIQNRRPTLVDQIEGFDIRHNGTVPSQRFFRVLTNSGFSLTNDECGVIENEFGDINGNIDYNRFFSQVMPKSAPQANPDEIVIRLNNFLKANKMQLKPRLERFDNTRSGSVTFAQMSAAFRAIGFDLTAPEQSALKAAYGHGPEGIVDYIDFYDLVDPKFEKPKEEKLEPLPRHDRNEDASISLAAMTKIAAICDRYQHNLSGEFRKYDMKNNGLILPDAFRCVIQNLPMRVEDNETEVLTKFYTSAGGYVSYEQFCQDMVDFGSKRIMQNPKIQTDLLAQEKTNSQNVDLVLHKLKIFLMNGRISPDTIFLPYDASSSGLIPRSRLQPILEGIGFPGLPSDFAVLGKAFADPRLPEKLNYKKLCQEINAINIDQRELAETRVDNLSETVADASTLRINCMIREKLAERHKRVRQPFSGVTSQLMSQRDFRRCIESYGLVIKEADMQNIMRVYKRNMNGDIDWNRFCTDVENANVIH
ncbi:EF hand family protein [Trichomonas vaginalis G3]|uniref:EF hand family protein n=1 Tax=Trichomonas vaginalis (strain ATCC PRA-98 / G3) TaxID=412133 RepID=A2F7P7_TRIV3|nr:EF-Hand calcium-binding domain-containing protein 6-related family [Trichomonas vaginalis G3]EAX99074.1 EF hand family protein [Trichomonas vaginalis G3]KAI5535010.1 EF-Hand calcium-binding domain-containing protein 6-related family [Trichomonas vaginalis G3]|eukprot:XP_001312004.1 EF hand family protein [Trichomonas vaginalis G3]